MTRPTPPAPPPAWTAPGVECLVCGREITPERVTLQGLGFWALPIHDAFSGFAPGPCGGTGRLLGPVL